MPASGILENILEAFLFFPKWLSPNDTGAILPLVHPKEQLIKEFQHSEGQAKASPVPQSTC